MPESTETRIPVSKDTRKELKILKATGDYGSYDELLRSIVSEQGGEYSG